MKTKFIYCRNEKCYQASPSGKTEHHLKGTAQNPAGTAVELVWECGKCGERHQEPMPTARCHKRTWPYHNASVGMTFESESHEQKYCAENKLTPINA